MDVFEVEEDVEKFLASIISDIQLKKSQVMEWWLLMMMESGDGDLAY